MLECGHEQEHQERDDQNAVKHRNRKRPTTDVEKNTGEARQHVEIKVYARHPPHPDRPAPKAVLPTNEPSTHASCPRRKGTESY